jgi:hypothetical protein
MRHADIDFRWAHVGLAMVLVNSSDTDVAVLVRLTCYRDHEPLAELVIRHDDSRYILLVEQETPLVNSCYCHPRLALAR